MEFCNLSEVVVRAEDDLDSLLDKVETATWLGVIQSTFTYFPYLRKEWKKNCDVERLLGISLTGQMDNPSLMNFEALKALKSRVLRISRKASKILGVNMPTLQPHVSSQVRHSLAARRFCLRSTPSLVSEYYIRQIQDLQPETPCSAMLKATGIPAPPRK